MRVSSGVPMRVPQHRAMTGEADGAGVVGINGDSRRSFAHHKRTWSATHAAAPRQRHDAEGRDARASGPPVMFCHGFPGLGYSFRHQLPAVAQAGWRGMAPDQRGYGRSERPWIGALRRRPGHAATCLACWMRSASARPYSSATTSARSRCAISPCATRTASRRVVIMSCPYDFDLAGRGGAGARQVSDRGGEARRVRGARHAPIGRLCRLARRHFFHMHYFQDGRACRSASSVHSRASSSCAYVHALSGAGAACWTGRSSRPQAPATSTCSAPAPPLPWSWLSEAEFEHYVREYMPRGGGPDIHRRTELLPRGGPQLGARRALCGCGTSTSRRCSSRARRMWC